MKSETRKFTGPKKIVIKNKEYSVEQVLTHKATKNEFLIKEIQAKGFIVYLIKTLGAPVDNRSNVYISYATLDEYYG